jgi:multidrug efflux system membrane fusion protein
VVARVLWVRELALDAKRRHPVVPGTAEADGGESARVADNVMRIDDVRATPPAPDTATARPQARQEPESDPDQIAEPDAISAEPRRRTPIWVIGARILVPLLIIAAGFGTFQYLKSTRPVQPAATPTETRFPVQTIAIALADVRPKLNLFGTSVAGREVQLRSLVAGRVIDTNPELRDGALIGRGEQLLRIDPFDYESSITETEAQRAEAAARREELEANLAVERGNLTFARQQLEIAKTDLRRAETLAGRGNLSDRALDDRRLVVTQRQQAVTQGENNLKVIEARIKQQDAALKRFDNALARARQRLADTKLVAPFDAYVTDVSAQTGRMLSVNDPVATLIDRKAIDVKFSLTDPQYGRLAGEQGALIGRPVKVVWDVGGTPITYDATIDRVAARVASNSGGIEVFARVTEPAADVPLRPGAFVRVSLDDTLYENVAKVPASAIYNRDTVFAVVDGRMQERKVEVVGLAGEDVLVKGAVKAGERIVTTRLSTPGTGVAVQER